MKKILIGILVGCLFSVIFLKSFPSEATQPKDSDKPKEQYSDYPFLAKRIFLDNPNDTIVNFIALREKLKKYVDSSPKKVGVYFEYLPTGVSVGVNDRDEFYRASLIKLPLVMRAYKMIEEGSIKKDEMLTVRRDLLDDSYGDLGKTGGGTTLPVSDVINLILTKSDNTAYNLLLDKVNQVFKEDKRQSERGIDEVNDFFDIPRSDSTNDFQITPKSYSSILKSLFFSSYLTYKSSNEIIEIMSNSTFTNGLPKFLPKEVKVSHKIGIYDAPDDKKGVHSDCGIVYLTNRQYVLCIMVASSEEEDSLKYISVISKMVFDYVSQANK